MELEFDVTMTSNVLYDYMMHHTYSSFPGIFGGVVGVMLLFGYMRQGSFLYLVAGAVVLLYLPCALWLRAKRQVLSTPAFREALHYKLTGEGIQVSQKDVTQSQGWDEMFKAVSTRNSIIVYTSRVNASIFPRRDLKDLTPKVIEMICTHMPPDKVRIRG